MHVLKESLLSGKHYQKRCAKLKTSDLHKKDSPKRVRFAWVTVSSSRYAKLREGEEIEDISYLRAKNILEMSGHQLTRYILVPDHPRFLLSALDALLDAQDVDIIIYSGGTGPTPDDVTVQTIRPLFDKEVEGFGDVFRTVSLKDAGSSSFLSNATAGIVSGKVIFLIPGSPGAVETALKELICPEAGHIISLARRGL